jgi:hypothetical protein
MLATLDAIEKALPKLSGPTKSFKLDSTKPWRHESEAHAHWMCGELRGMIQKGECPEDKFNRWIGWIQATAWIAGAVSIEDCMNTIRNNWRV